MTKLDIKSGTHCEILVDGTSIARVNTKDGNTTVYLADSVRIGTDVAKRDGKNVSTKRKTKTAAGRSSQFNKTEMKRMITCRNKGLSAAETSIKLWGEDTWSRSVSAFWANHTRGAYSV